ncbi:hypothetical protein [Roseomonas gilardii]|uniref:hypothetical protein n=1 Tax=Roseomonas gilardii TaxID=257708 RepID=UPI0012EBAEC4|nr:hypothetical protein [Roseomonas gilardii]
MGKPEEWVGSALLAQPFYTEELRMTGLLAPPLRVGLMSLVHLPGYRWGGAAIRRQSNI